MTGGLVLVLLTFTTISVFAVVIFLFMLDIASETEESSVSRDAFQGHANLKDKFLTGGRRNRFSSKMY